MLIKCYGEFSWLPNSSLAGVTLPEIEFIDQKYFQLECSGFYNHESHKIIIMEDNPELHAAAIAHEFWHHHQLMSGVDMSNPPRIDGELSFEQSIIKYFKGSWQEYEALLFEQKVAKNWSNDWWLRGLVGGFEA